MERPHLRLPMPCSKANKVQISIFTTEHLSNIFKRLQRRLTVTSATTQKVQHGKLQSKMTVMTSLMQTDSATSSSRSHFGFRFRAESRCSEMSPKHASGGPRPNHDLDPPDGYAYSVDLVAVRRCRSGKICHCPFNLWSAARRNISQLQDSSSFVQIPHGIPSNLLLLPSYISSSNKYGSPAYHKCKN